MDWQSIEGKRIIIAPLNWGLGHATRSAALINVLRIKNDITLASDGAAFSWLENEYADLEIIRLPELKMRYSRLFGASGGVLLRLGHFLRSIQRDYAALNKIIANREVDLIISDNRYGCYSEKITSVLLTHQLQFDSFFSELIALPLQNFIEKFDEVWIPDDEDHRYSGKLSIPFSKLKIPIHYIGLLSRFSKNRRKDKELKITLIASGLEPFRSELIQYFYHNFSLLDFPTCIVAGGWTNLPAASDLIEVYGVLSSTELEDIIDRSDYIVCRSGYSSIMDMVYKDQKAVLIPTPNQPEQLYLAKKHADNPLFASAIQSSDISDIMKKIVNLVL
jgi:predicted glycosyltransferase